MSKHSLFRLTQKLYNQPHLISQNSFKNIESYLELRNSGMMLPMQPEVPEVPEEPDDLDDIEGIGVIEICGPLTDKKTGWEAMCGGCSYESILDQAEDHIENGCSTIILNISSGGGSSFGAFECANDLRAMCDEANIKLISYVQDCAASAAYLIACVADEVVCNPYGETGSIGVLISLTDKSKHMEQEGIKPIFITAGDEKIPYAEDGSFRPEFLADLQSKVDFLYGEFISHVANYTNMSEEEVKATQAKTFLAKDAINIGLINKIMTNKEFVKYIVSQTPMTMQGVEND